MKAPKDEFNLTLKLHVRRNKASLPWLVVAGLVPSLLKSWERLGKFLAGAD